VIDKLQKKIQASLGDPDLKSKLAALDITPEYAPGADLHKRVVTDLKNWSTFIEAKGLKGR
jgi:tripartite-type tricarboxylate transporter receptor subunit TctC